MPVLRLSLLGGFAVELEGKPLNPFRTDKERLLLAYLAVEGGHFHRRESLAGLFWPESSERRARHSLSQALYALRSSLQAYGGDSFLEISPQEVLFRLESTWLDVREFEALLRQCDEHDHSPEWPCRSCLDSLERAAVLYQGDFLAGFTLEGCAAFEEWMLVLQEAARQEMIKIVGRLSLGFEALGEIEKALAWANRQVGLDPLDEAAHRQVMRLLARQGRRQDALAQYAVCQKILNEELGIEPGAETVALFQQILEKADVGIYTTARHNLPAPLIPLVGRQAELEKICLKLAAPDCRLLTVLGAGGVGKSRLALEAGRCLLPAFPDGVFLVELDTQPGHQSLALLIARAFHLELGVPSDRIGHQTSLDTDTVLEQLYGHLENKNLLLILDGFEGMLSQSNLVSSLLSRASRLKIMITSRARLNLDAEHIFSLEGLAYPETGQIAIEVDLEAYSAVQLFVASAQRSASDFSLTETNQIDVAEICRLTQGIPLGILLAAAWIEMLPPVQIVQEIQGSLDFLACDWPGLPDRQRSLRATFDYSFELMTEAEKNIFLRLCIFHSPFTLQRAAQVTGATLPQLRSMISKSLLIHASDERYRMHDLLREYAQEKLANSSAEHQAVHERHCRVYMQALTDWEPRLKCREQPIALVEMDQEYADILAAWEWALDQEDIAGLEKTEDSLYRYHILRGMSVELGVICQKAARCLEDKGINAASLRLWLRLATMQAQAFFNFRQFDKGFQVIQQVDAQLQKWRELAIALRREIAMLHLTRGSGYLFSGGNRLKARESYQHGLELIYRGEDSWDISFALYCVSMINGQVGFIQEMGRYAKEALTIQKSLGDPYVLANIYAQLGFYSMLIGDYQAGLKAAEEEKSNRQRIGDPINQAIGDEQFGLALFFAGQYEQAGLLFQRAIPFFDKPSLKHYREGCQLFLAGVELFTGRYQAVLDDVVYGGEPLSMDASAQVDLFKAHVHLFQADKAALLRKSWEDPEAVSLYALAEQELGGNYLKYLRSLPRLDWVGVPLALLGYISYRFSRLEEARQYLEDALENGLTQGLFWVFMLALSVLALILAEAGEFEEAIELYATATSHPCAANSRWWEDMFGRRLAALTNHLPAETLTAAQARGKERRLAYAGQQYLDWLKTSPDLLENLGSRKSADR